MVARGNGDGHGGARLRVGQLRLADGITALMVYPTSISITHWTKSKGKRGGSKRLERHSHVRARPPAVMATRWSRAHGELYLRRKWDDGGVADVEELTVVLWFRGIGQWRSVLVDFGSAAAIASRPPCSWRKEMAGVKWRGERRVNEALGFIWGTDT